ncbi:hypothetical protein FRC10_000752 [Ceratobasidium sp. 414]|nr:hypothetical protein FRC10_000752 [Ceratobasidium sp. 414]
MDEDSDDYSELELTEEVLKATDAPLDHHLSCGALVFGSDAYASDYRQHLALVTKERTGFTPHSWQLDCAVSAHLGIDVLVIAGTGAGKTLPMVANCWLNPHLIVFLVLPLNALGNQQAKKFRDWKINAIAVNATTHYPGLYKDALEGRYQVIISSIEVFTDTTRLLPVVKSVELASRGPQQLVLDEVHLALNISPQVLDFMIGVGDLPCIAATATANLPMRESIRQVLRFGVNSQTINLGNHRSNLAYSVHRLAHASASVSEILDYFPSRVSFPRFMLIFVDSRPLGQAVLHTIGQHVLPSLRWQVQIYHAFRSDFAKDILSAAFERDDGFKVLVCTEAVALGVDFRKVSVVIQMLSPTDLEIQLQRLGHGGHWEEILCEAILMAQNSMFSNSKEGQKQVQKALKTEEAPLPVPPSKKSSAVKRSNAASKSTAKCAPREYSEAIYHFINTTGCRVEVLDKEFDNPPRQNNLPCHCDFHRQERGELSFRELMKQEATTNRPTEVDPGPRNIASVQEVIAEESDSNISSNSDLEAPGVHQPSSALSLKFRKPAERKLYATALQDWVDKKFDSPECEFLDITKDWILSPKEIANRARYSGLTSLGALAELRPPWVHLERWGAEILEVLGTVTATLDAQEEARQQAAEAKRQEAMERARAEQESREQWAAERQHKMAEALQASAMPVVSKKRRLALPANTTEEEKAAREEEIHQERRQKSQKNYWLKKAREQEQNQVKVETEYIQNMPVASSSCLPATSALSQVVSTLSEHKIGSDIASAPPAHSIFGSGPYGHHIVTFSTKQELVDDQDRLLGHTDATATPNRFPTHPLSILHHSATPMTPEQPQVFQFDIQTPETMQQVFNQPVRTSQPKAKGKKPQANLPLTQNDLPPPVPRVRRQPKPKQPKIEENDPPPQ